MSPSISPEPADERTLEPRIARLEEDLTAVKMDVAVIRSNYATKDYLHKELNAQTWRLTTFVCGFGTVLAGAIYFIAVNVR
jgi:hypothetical protein